MSRTWQVQTAKARFSEFLEASLRDGPQVVTKRGVEDRCARADRPVAADGEHHETEPEGSIARTRGAQRLTHFRTRRPSASRHARVGLGPCSCSTPTSYRNCGVRDLIAPSFSGLKQCRRTSCSSPQSLSARYSRGSRPRVNATPQRRMNWKPGWTGSSKVTGSYPWIRLHSGLGHGSDTEARAGPSKTR